MKPNLFLVGAPKCASSAISNYLAQHPEITCCFLKEPNYFCKDLDIPSPKSESDYLSLFDIKSTTKAVMDSSILCMYSKLAAKTISEFSESPKIVAVLRNPVDATHAWHSQMVYTSNEPIIDFPSAIAAEEQRRHGCLLPKFGTSSTCPQLLYYTEVMRFGEQIKRYFDIFDKNQIFVIIYDDFIKNPEKVYGELLKFIGVEASFRPNFDVIGSNRVRTNPKLHMWLKSKFAKTAREILPFKFRFKIIKHIDKLTSQEQPRIPLDTKLRDQLNNNFRSDISLLSDILNRDMNYWVN